ncbi:hypothetical protein OH76DRAFT_1555123 [Lentinus brumalis]|uniref:Fungal-type protein kinase domain-containing protein n=1 Tax=Lentinus brumalis TaxID=2498619 RepID=A0A371DFV5_9APHY|nr:hypothetical protein OH76DRAFT_1555123 [Polyporus brumalis]
MGPHFCEYPIDKFLKCVPGEAPTAKERTQFEQVDWSKANVEEDWCLLMNKTVNSVFEASGSMSLAFLDTSIYRASGSVGPDGKKTQTRAQTLNDAGVYWDTDEARDATKLTAEQIKNSTLTPEELKARGRVGARNWHWIVVPLEIKHDRKKTAFSFREPAPQKNISCPTANISQHPSSTVAVEGDYTSFSAPTSLSGQAEEEDQTGDTSANAEAPLAQFVEQMLNLLYCQHRQFCYGIYVWQCMARLCYFDRGGAIVSEDFNWTSTDSPLHDFLWRVAHMSRDDLGYDPTATLLEKTDEEQAKPFKAMANNPTVPAAVQGYVKAATAEGVPIYKLSIIPMGAPPDEGLPEDPLAPPSQSSDPDVQPSDPESSASPTEPFPGSNSPLPTPDSSSSPPAEPRAREFLVGEPHFATNSLFGRCTRGYVAYDLQTGRLCFLKDYWRPYVPGHTRPEHLVLEHLNRCKVRHIATLICGGDVGGYRAQETKGQVLLHHTKAPPVPRIHYRLATEEIGLPVEEFKNFRQLAAVFLDAINAHKDAWKEAKVLHGDISVGNIIIDALTKRGILIDWDLARFQCELGSGPHEPDRAGTWEFRSALALAYPRKPQRVSDDLESFIHAFYYLVLKYHSTSLISLKEFVETTFENASLVRGVKVGGQAKLTYFALKRPRFKVRNNPVLQEVLEAIHKGCYESYQQIDFDQMEELYAIHEPALETLPGVPDVGEDEDELEDAFSVQEPVHWTQPTTTASESQAVSDVDGSRSGDLVADASDPGHSDASVHEPLTESDSDGEASDPCVVTGFLSDHQQLAKILKNKYKPAKPLDDKRSNQFLLRSTRFLEVIPSEVYHSTNYSSSDVPTFAAGTGKRPREPQDEGEVPDRQSDNTAEGDNEDLPQESGRLGRKKRQRV